MLEIEYLGCLLHFLCKAIDELFAFCLAHPLCLFLWCILLGGDLDYASNVLLDGLSNDSVLLIVPYLYLSSAVRLRDSALH